jgi:alkylation response protein AidB-like acyl-CoA dehydrogenase
MTKMRNRLGGIGLYEEHAELANVASTFCANESPISTVRELIAAGKSYKDSTWDKMCELGWLGIAIPEEYGGLGLSLGHVVPIVEQMGRSLMSGPYISTTLAAQIINHGGTEAQKANWLPKLTSGTKAAIALTEIGDNIEPENTKTTATIRGESIELSGSKILVTDLDTCDIVVCSALLDGDLIFLILQVDMIRSAGQRREKVIDETRASYELSLEKLVVPAEHMLVRERSEKTFKHLHLATNLLLSAEMCGGTQSCLEYTVEYLRTRKQFGKQIGAFQALKHTIVDAYCEYEKARSHLYSAAWCFEKPDKGEMAIRMAKIQADKAFKLTADRSIQFHGGFGFTYDCDAQLYRRRAMWCAALQGDSEYHAHILGTLLFSNEK